MIFLTFFKINMKHLQSKIFLSGRGVSQFYVSQAELGLFFGSTSTILRSTNIWKYVKSMTFCVTCQKE